MSALTTTASALPSVERARALLSECRTSQEVRRIRAIAQAVATLERGKEIAIDAGEIVVWADRRIGELSAELPKASAGRPEKIGSCEKPITKRAALEAHGLTKKRAHEAEKIAAMPERDVRAYLAASRKAGEVPSAAAAATLGKLTPERREQTLAKLGDVGDVRKAIGAVRQDLKREVAAKIAAEPAPLPTGPFRVIVADPPWPYDKRVEDVSHRGANPYPVMSIEDICAMPVQSRAHDDAILWLWTTNAFMREAFQVIDAWGFHEKTILTWAKDRMGVGDWLRGKTEHCVLATRGKPVVTLTNQTTLLAADVREHSRKPDEFYSLVDALCPGSKLELFARQARAGWQAWGAETAKFSGEAP